ncbi:MFS transporter [Alphaproteobacteria bacterium]|nr:MFS transporter [Alphaproteobacteria bacterium]
MMSLAFFSKKFCVGLSYGTSFPLTIVILDYWLKECEVSNSAIGLFTLLHLLFTLKFLWGPTIDNRDIPFLSKLLGRGKSWVIASQLTLIFGIVCMAHLDPGSNTVALMFFASLISFADGCQNVALYPYQISDVSPKDLGYVAGVIGFGHRIGGIFTKFVTLHMAHFFGWTIAYESAAFLIFLCMIFALLMPNPKPSGSDDYKNLSTFSTMKKIIKQIMERGDGPYVLFILIMYKAAPSMIQKMSRPFCLEMGFTKLEIANVVQLFGSISIIIGGFIGGFLINKIGTRKTMLYAGILRMLSSYLYILLWLYGPDTRVLGIVVFVEGIMEGVAAAAFLAFFYELCSGGSQYALLSAIRELGVLLFSSVSGLLVDGVGWLDYFIIVPILFLPSLWILHKGPKNQRLATK